ncbi:Lytic transglycosylase domain-containing protein OS=Streptomyces tendae OX=1932 GN=GUR47_12510 PE=4 SV=1 [Streptomyces tendae]
MVAHFDRRLRKAAPTTTVAAVAVAALSASQAPEVTADGNGRQTTADNAPTSHVLRAERHRHSPHTPPAAPQQPQPRPDHGHPLLPGLLQAGIPATVLDAYKKAELAAPVQARLPPWQLLAAIGKVESGQARGGRVDAGGGTTIGRIIGPQLDGNGFALIKDTDNGVYDGNSSYDNAVGPMQFIPSTWAWAGRDGNGDGKDDPNNVYDAALAAGHYLCRNGWDLSVQADLNRAILGYNNSQDYLNTVLSWLEHYRRGTHEIPDGTGSLPVGRSDDPFTGVSPSPGRTGANTGSRAPSTASPSPDPSPTSRRPRASPAPGARAPSPPRSRRRRPGAPRPAPLPPTRAPFGERRHHGAHRDRGRRVHPADQHPRRDQVRKGRRQGAHPLHRPGRHGRHLHRRREGRRGHHQRLRGGRRARAGGGRQTGEFTVRATVIGRSVPGLDYKATVTERVADALTTTGATELACTPGGEFADPVTAKATLKGAVADKVAVTATLIKSGADPTENDKGPYFKDADGKAVRTLAGRKTDAKGLLELPKLYADDAEGSYVLRLTTAGGAQLDITLKVAKAPNRRRTRPPSRRRSRRRRHRPARRALPAGPGHLPSRALVYRVGSAVAGSSGHGCFGYRPRSSARTPL